jgi:predicted small integral membrane protein
LAGTLASPRFLLRPRRSLDAVARCQADLEFDDLVPDGIGALVVWNRQQFAQAPPRIGCLRFAANRRRRLFFGHGVCYRLLDGLFFIHLYIIARIIGSVPMLLVAQVRLWGFLLRLPDFDFANL